MQKNDDLKYEKKCDLLDGDGVVGNGRVSVPDRPVEKGRINGYLVCDDDGGPTAHLLGWDQGATAAGWSGRRERRLSWFWSLLLNNSDLRCFRCLHLWLLNFRHRWFILAHHKHTMNL